MFSLSFLPPGFRNIGDLERECQRHVGADDGGGLQEALGFDRQKVDARGEHGLYGSRHLDAIALSTCVLIAMISYLTWTPVGAPLIAGLQGRYVLPLIVPWAVLLQWPRWAQSALGPRTRLAVAGACLIYAMFFLGHAFKVVARRYWL